MKLRKSLVVLLGLAAAAAAGVCAVVWAGDVGGLPDGQQEAAAQILATKIAESTGGDPADYLPYCRCLTITLKQFTSEQRANAMGHDPVPMLGDPDPDDPFSNPGKGKGKGKGLTK